MEATPRAALLGMLRRAAVTAPDTESGIAAVMARAPVEAPAEAWRAAIAALIGEGLVADPVVLEPGALQCRWRLALTASGRDTAG